MKLVDADADGVSSADDCDDGDPGLIATPAEISGLVVSPIAGGHRFSWSSQAATAGPATVYDVLKGLLSLVRPNGNFMTAGCAGEDLPLPEFDDLGANPSPGLVFFYLVRGQYGCPNGS